MATRPTDLRPARKMARRRQSRSRPRKLKLWRTHAKLATTGDLLATVTCDEQLTVDALASKIAEEAGEGAMLQLVKDGVILNATKTLHDVGLEDGNDVSVLRTEGAHIVVKAEDEDKKVFLWCTQHPWHSPLRELAKAWARAHALPDDSVGLQTVEAGLDDPLLDLSLSPDELGWQVGGETRVLYALVYID